ncbi:MAG: hypothetical protein WD717_04410 [Nitrosarchaeum sp.]
MEKIDYHKAVASFEKESNKRTNFSYDPVSDKAYDVSNLEDANELYKQYGNGVDPIYIIGVTNNATGKLDNETMKAYLDLQKDGKVPFLGQWTSPSGKKFKDVSYLDGNIDETEALRLKTLFNQEGVLKVKSNGRWEII